MIRKSSKTSSGSATTSGVSQSIQTSLDFAGDLSPVAPLRGAEKLGNRRVTGKEQYYTPPQVVEVVLDCLDRAFPNWVERPFLEPAGGTGSFIDAALNRGVLEITSWDIEPLHPLVNRGDFLAQSLALKGAVCATNPPFGRNHALSIPFFNHAANFCDVIAFIVPRSWRKWTIQNKLNRSFHLVSDQDLQVNYLAADGSEAHAFDKLRTCIQVWSRQDAHRNLVRIRDRGVVKKCAPDEADVSLTIFGYGCGTVKTDFDRRKNTTQMYLKLQHPLALEALETVDFSRFYMNTATTEALSIQEINYLLNEHIFGDPGLESH